MNERIGTKVMKKMNWAVCAMWCSSGSFYRSPKRSANHFRGLACPSMIAYIASATLRTGRSRGWIVERVGDAVALGLVQVREG